MSNVSAKQPSVKKKQSQGLSPTVFWRIAEDVPRPLQWTLMIISISVPFFSWWALSTWGGVREVFLPGPMQVGEAFVRLWEQGFLLQDTVASFLRVAGGFSLAALVSVPVGVSMGAFASVRALFEPLIGIIRYMPASAFVPLLILYLGLGEEPKIFLIFIGTLFFNILMIMDAVKFVPKELIETTYTLGGQRLQVLFKVIFPYVIPNIIDAFRINIATSWNLVIVAELVAAEDGLGRRILRAQRVLNTDEIFACLIVLGLIGFLIDLSFRFLLRMSCKWAV